VNGVQPSVLSIEENICERSDDSQSQATCHSQLEA
jgi:hypothetical protein